MQVLMKIRLVLLLVLAACLSVVGGCGSEPPKDAATLQQEAVELDAEVAEGESEL